MSVENDRAINRIPSFLVSAIIMKTEYGMGHLLFVRKTKKDRNLMNWQNI